MYRFASSVRHEFVEDKVYALDLDSGKYLVIADTGALIVRSLLEGSDLEEICDKLVRTYAVDAIEVRKDTIQFLNDLIQQKFLVHA